MIDTYKPLIMFRILSAMVMDDDDFVFDVLQRFSFFLFPSTFFSVCYVNIFMIFFLDCISPNDAQPLSL